MKKLITLSFAFILILSVRAQTIDVDAMIGFVGSRVDDPVAQRFFNLYEIKHSSGVKYSSTKYGIDITANNDTIFDLSFYRSNSLYGSYTNKLPKGISFGMTSPDVIKKLGKPTTLYMNTGYAEYDLGKYVMNYWFEQGVLTQVTILIK